MSICGNMVGGAAPLKTLIIQDENGNELVGTVVGEEVIFTATDSDVREGSVYAGDAGVSTGTKVIPSYYTTQMSKLITSGSSFSIKLPDNDLYDYTKFQAIICLFNTSDAQSVSSEKVVIDDNVYDVLSTTPLSTVVMNSTTKTIELGIQNTSESMYLIRLFTYKEIY